MNNDDKTINSVLLATIEQRMESLAINGGDPEIDHSDADDLLVKALSLLAFRNEEIAEIVGGIIHHYQNVVKWYA